MSGNINSCTIGVRIVNKHCLYDANMPTKSSKDVAPCFVLPANRFLVGVLRGDGLRHCAVIIHFNQ
jgi:hypothetical protein